MEKKLNLTMHFCEKKTISSSDILQIENNSWVILFSEVGNASLKNLSLMVPKNSCKNDPRHTNWAAE